MKWTAQRSPRSPVEPEHKIRYEFLMQAEYSHLLKLGRAERLQLVEDLWDSLAAEEEGLPIADWKIEELRRRKEHFLQHPESGRTWEQVKERARSQNG